MRYGFVGLGHLGQASRGESGARRLRGRGASISTAGSADAVARGRRDLGRRRSPALAASLRLPDHLPALARRPPPRSWRRRLPVMRAGSTWIEMSTNDFAEVEALAARAEELGHRHPRLPGHRRRASRRGRRHHRTCWRRATSVRAPRAGARRPWAVASFIWAASSRRRSPRWSPTCWRSFI